MSINNSNLDIPIEVSQVIAPRPKLALRTAVEDVFWQMGGSEAMFQWVGESTVNKRIFYKDILPKMIPREMRGEITGADGGPMKMVIEWAGVEQEKTPLPSIALAHIVSEVIQANNEED